MSRFAFLQRMVRRVRVLQIETTPSGSGGSAQSCHRATWSAGDYAIVGAALQIVGESRCETLDPRAGSRVLDVAAGNGNASLAAARRRCDVTSTDYVPALLERGRARAAADGLPMRFQEADADADADAEAEAEAAALPFADASFDAVASLQSVFDEVLTSLRVPARSPRCRFSSCPSLP